MKKYDITKKECLKSAGDRVCSCCGRKLQALRTVNNSGQRTYWLGCMHDQTGLGHFDRGVDKEVFRKAIKYLVKYGAIDYNVNELRNTYLACKLILEIQELETEGYSRFSNWDEFVLSLKDHTKK